MVVWGAWGSRSKGLDDGGLENSGGVEWWPAVAVVVAGSWMSARVSKTRKERDEDEVVRCWCVLLMNRKPQGPHL